MKPKSSVNAACGSGVTVACRIFGPIQALESRGGPGCRRQSTSIQHVPVWMLGLKGSWLRDRVGRHFLEVIVESRATAAAILIHTFVNLSSSLNCTNHVD